MSRVHQSAIDALMALQLAPGTDDAARRDLARAVDALYRDRQQRRACGVRVGFERGGHASLAAVLVTRGVIEGLLAAWDEVRETVPEGVGYSRAKGRLTEGLRGLLKQIPEVGK